MHCAGHVGAVGVGLERLHQRRLKRADVGESALPFVFGCLVARGLESFLTVLRDSPARLAISLLQSSSRNFMRLTLPIICDHLLALLLKYSAGQFNTLVNFESALLGLESQFSVGGKNTG